MRNKLRSIQAIGFGVFLWAASLGVAQAQFGGLQIEIGRYGGPYSGPLGGSGLYLGGFNVPFGVGPSIPPSSRGYIGPQYQSGYRGYRGYGVGPSLDLYVSPFDYASPSYRNYDLALQQYRLQRQQLELEAAQRRLSLQQAYPYSAQRSYTGQSPRGDSPSDLRPGMVLPDGSTVISVGPLTPINSGTQQPTAPLNALPPGTPKPNRASF